MGWTSRPAAASGQSRCRRRVPTTLSCHRHFTAVRAAFAGLRGARHRARGAPTLRHETFGRPAATRRASANASCTSPSAT
eukprot:7200529-Pyramimonas_sp.AAC.1